ncbi:MAG: hypothetical protein FWF28_02580, partial [Micrococcales bacterium]|nr:hypothetical protein [Micrococcales bacterium]
MRTAIDVAFRSMREIVLAGALRNVRFAVSPLAELALSLSALQHSDAYRYLAGWSDATAAARRTIGADRLLALVNPEHWVPDLCFIRPD